MVMMVMVTMMVNFCDDDDCYLVMKVTLVKEVMSCDVSPVAIFIVADLNALQSLVYFTLKSHYLATCQLPKSLQSNAAPMSEARALSFLSTGQ